MRPLAQGFPRKHDSTCFQNNAAISDRARRMIALLPVGNCERAMTTDLSISQHLVKDRFERLQTWVGLDRESEWFTIPASGVGLQVEGSTLRALPTVVEAASGAGEIRLRAVLVTVASESRVRIEASLTDGGLITLLDAFGTDRLQLLPGLPRVHADLAPGRYSVDAVLPAQSTLHLAIVEPRRTALVRSRVG